jgi:hypothetical protein
MTQKSQARLKPAAALAQPKPRTLAPIQQFICDELADFLVNGGTEDEVDRLLRVALVHHDRRLWRNRPDDENEDSVEGVRKRRLELRRAELLTAWHENKRAEPVEMVQPKTATERIRLQVLTLLRSDFEDFLRHSTPEERWLMHSVLSSHFNANRGSEAFDEIALVSAFECALGSAESDYVKVPEQFRNQVERYIDALKANEGKRTRRCA